MYAASMRSDLSIKFKPEFGHVGIIVLDAELDVDPLNLSPESISGKFTGDVENQIIQFELNLADVELNYIGKKYRFERLDRTGAFTLRRGW